MAFVQSKSGVTSFATSVAAAFNSNNTAGNCLIAIVGNDNSVTPTISDSSATNWEPRLGGLTDVSVFVAYNCAAGANTVTASFGATDCAASIAVIEWSGVLTAAAFDQIATGSGFGTAATTANTGTTAQADELLIVGTCREAANSPFTFTPGSGWTEAEDTGGLCPRPIQLAYQVVAAAAAYAGAATLQGGSENWWQVIATFKLGAAAPPVDWTVRNKNARRPRPFAPGLAR